MGPMKSTRQDGGQKPTKLIVLTAFIRDGEGELRPAFDPREMQSESAAHTQARILSHSGAYAGVLSWWRSADLQNGEFGEPIEIFRWGDVPDME